ncbi:hypothetical protein MOQ_008019, partial [Trypanosoma cruzi marinkellei]
AFNVADAGSNAEHTAGQQKQKKAKNNHNNYSYFIHRTTVDAHMSLWLSAGTHSPHTPLQHTAVYASADTASSSGAHTHAELLRLPSISRRRDGARVVVVVGTSVFLVILGVSSAVVVVVVVVVGAFVVVVVVVVFGVCTLAFLLFLEFSVLCSGLFTTEPWNLSGEPGGLGLPPPESDRSDALSPSCLVGNSASTSPVTAKTDRPGSPAPPGSDTVGGFGSK